jgi:uncharacterized protein with von Willebrand factor type A (vWA) domain
MNIEESVLLSGSKTESSSFSGLTNGSDPMVLGFDLSNSATQIAQKPVPTGYTETKAIAEVYNLSQFSPIYYVFPASRIS